MKLKHRILLLIYSYLNLRRKVKKFFSRKKYPLDKKTMKEVKDKYENRN